MPLISEVIDLSSLAVELSNEGLLTLEKLTTRIVVILEG